MIIYCCLFVIDICEHLIKQLSKNYEHQDSPTILSTGWFRHEKVDQCQYAMSIFYASFSILVTKLSAH